VQDRYAGDFGDYIKISLLRSLSVGRTLGVAWYLYPNENHNSDGRHTKYLSMPNHWRKLDPGLFDDLRRIVYSGRSVRSLQCNLATNTLFMSVPIPTNLPSHARSTARQSWFDQVVERLANCGLLFADPDNGLVDDQDFRRRSLIFGKQIPVTEARTLSQGRCVVLYHHNSRFKGGHDAEVDHWLRAIGLPTLAVRATAYGCRTFFIVNPDAEIVVRTQEFCKRWENHKVRLHRAWIA